MGVLFRIAWRNLWRQRRRSLLTASAMAVGVAMCMGMIALVDGMYARMFDVLVTQSLGHVQLHHPAFPADQQLQDTVGGLSARLSAIDTDPAIRGAAPRLLAFGLAAGESDAVGARFTGILPAREDAVSGLAAKVVEGTYLSDEQADAVLLGAGLADKLKVKVGGSVVLITQAADGSMGNAVFQVVGLVETGSAALDAGSAWVHLAPLQEVLALQDQAHELVVQLHDPERLEEGRTKIQAGAAGTELLVRTWQEANPTAAKLLGSQNVGKAIMLGIVFSVAALGVLNTMLMSVFERTRELGVLRAIGMTPLRVLGLVLAEATLLGGLSSAAGLLLGGLFDLFLVYRGIDMSLDGKGMSYAGIRFDPIIRGEVHADGILMTIGFVFFVSIVAAIWPAIRAARLRPVDAMRQV